MISNSILNLNSFDETFFKNENLYKKIDRSEWFGWNDLPRAKEGHTGRYIDYQSFLYNLIKELRPKNILEIGFNAGHSACCFLNASPTAKMITFDICRHGTEEISIEILKKNFDITLIKGDSTVTVPDFLSKNKIEFDFIFVDGGHEDDVPYKDIINTKQYLKKDGFLLIDDTDNHYIINGITKSNILTEFVEIKFNEVENVKKQKQFRLFKKL